MPTAETEAHLEGAVNLYRYNQHDIFNVTVWVGFAVGVAVVCWLVLHAVLLAHPATSHVCGTIAQCQRQILAHPLHVKPLPGVPTYHGPSFGNTP